MGIIWEEVVVFRKYLRVVYRISSGLVLGEAK